ncbi:unnamed protein product [Timema podura]|uniref:AB hydrolase-1 domain-containing protein n=1 Tax=Timema podura TaxID=61482 RepID=A0ABN7NDL2_TIMPD|nr:unnamed protein product [Timema podura]
MNRTISDSGEAKVETAEPTQRVIEIQIPVSWGYVAAQSWGDISHQPVLAVHGRQDNAATFNHLIPLLPRGKYHFLCIDLPGHGLSSHFPAGLLYRVLTDYIITVRKVVDHFKWRQVIYMGHSLGGLVGYYFAGVFPELVKKLIVIDMMSHGNLPTHHHTKLIRHYYEKLHEFEEKSSTNQPPRYSYKEALSRVITGRTSELSIASAKTLLTRDLKQVSEDRYIFRKDQRVKFLVFPIISNEQHMTLLSSVRCPLLLIMGNQSSLKNFVLAQELLQMFEKNCEEFRYFVVEGGHDLHLNNPERVAPLVTSFLNSTELKSSL